MAFLNLAKEYTKQLIHKEKTFNEILKLIDNLVYTENNQKLSQQDKISFLQEIKKSLTKEFGIKEYLTNQKSFKIDIYNTMVSEINKILRENISKKNERNRD